MIMTSTGLGLFLSEDSRNKLYKLICLSCGGNNVKSITGLIFKTKKYTTLVRCTNGFRKNQLSSNRIYYALSEINSFCSGTRTIRINFTVS